MPRLPPPPPPLSTDIFCRVVDNYGDIGVCWRLARQLAGEYGFPVRLWVDRLASFVRICPQIDPLQTVQRVSGVEVRPWPADAAAFDEVVPADFVVETFACHLPENFIAAMAARAKRPVWVNLDYLSAEAWVAGCHGLPSPHPRLPLVKSFFFPGFSAATGGLLRERELVAERDAFLASPAQQAAFWRALGQSRPPAGALLVSLFSYANPALPGLLAAWAAGPQPVCCLLPESVSVSAVEAFVGRSLPAGAVVRSGALEIRALPFVAQPDYDRLLWACDINFVRGEDSFVRAQWAARPLVWQLYPQDEDAHLAKLDAFLGLYCAGLPNAPAAALSGAFRAWNGAGPVDAACWARFAEALPALRQHALDWAKARASDEDLCSNLVRFCRSKL